MISTSRRQPLLAGLDDHAAEPRVDRQAGQLAADVGRVTCRRSSGRVAGAQLLQQPDAVGDVALRRAGRRTGSRPCRPGPSAAICRMTEARLVRRISGSVNSGRAAKSVLAVQPDADAVRGPAAAALALVGRGLRDRLDGQPLDLGPVAVAGDPRGPGVDHVLDAGHGQRGLGHVGGQHHAPPRCGWNTWYCSAADSRAYSGRISRPPAWLSPPKVAQRVRGVADLPLAAEEDQDVAGPAPRAARATASPMAWTWSRGSSSGWSGSVTGS